MQVKVKNPIPPTQEKFQISHFGIKKGNNRVFNGMKLGKPITGKMLPLP